MCEGRRGTEGAKEALSVASHSSRMSHSDDLGKTVGIGIPADCLSLLISDRNFFTVLSSDGGGGGGGIPPLPGGAPLPPLGASRQRHAPHCWEVAREEAGAPPPRSHRQIGANELLCPCSTLIQPGCVHLSCQMQGGRSTPSSRMGAPRRGNPQAFSNIPFPSYTCTCTAL